MKSKLAASINLFRAVNRSTNTRNAIASRSMLANFHRRRCLINSSFQAQGFEISERAFHSSASEDDDHDDFSELGPENSECSLKQIKLVTEKRDCLKKTYSSRRDLGGAPLSSDTRPNLKEIVASIGKVSQNSNSKIVGRDHASALADDTKKTSNIESPRPVSVKNVPSTVGLSELVESVSVFGKVSGASFVNASNGLRCCNIEFEDVESSQRAILVGKVAVGSQVMPVQPVDAVDVVTIRIKNINKDTTDFAIHSRCKSVGEFVGLSRTSKDAVDAFFNVRDDKIHLNILKKLNNTVVDCNVWSADVLQCKSKPTEEPSAKDARYKLGLQIVDQFTELKWQSVLIKIDLEDLEILNASIMHIEDLHID
ncbi:hypothetical protein ABFX02_04G009300 [Erythranthe guttata]